MGVIDKLGLFGSTLLRKGKYSNLLGLRRLLNLAYYDPRYVVLPRDKYDYAVADGCKFHLDWEARDMERVNGNPWFAHIEKTDVVLNIGACVGSVAIPMAFKAKHVYAVEPLFGGQLRANIALNGLRNITVLDCALGQNNGMVHIAFSTKAGWCSTVSFASLLKSVGHVDVLVMDCEGEEWNIIPTQLLGIREIRLEFHVRQSMAQQDERDLERWLAWFDSAGYNWVILKESKPKFVGLKRILAVTASKTG